MRKFVLPILLSLQMPSAFAKDHNFQPGKLVDVTTDDRLGAAQTRRKAILVVDLDDLEYTLDAGRVPPNGRDYAHGLIVGDPVQVSVEDKDVVLRLPNGKDLKTAIIKRSRLNSH